MHPGYLLMAYERRDCELQQHLVPSQLMQLSNRANNHNFAAIC